jgi:hypothetical protein
MCSDLGVAAQRLKVKAESNDSQKLKAQSQKLKAI